MACEKNITLSKQLRGVIIFSEMQAWEGGEKDVE